MHRNQAEYPVIVAPEHPLLHQVNPHVVVDTSCQVFEPSNRVHET